jgi:uncharacterized protein YkwD
MLIRAATALAAGLCVACASSPVTTAHRTAPAGPDATRIGAGIALAEDDMYANHYTPADAVYAGLLAAAPRNAAIRAAHALFLAYSGQPGARAEASRAVSIDPADGHAEAVLCRTEDWAGDLPAALSAGKAGIRLAPNDPLAHLFLAEALADTGDDSRARTEIDAATTLIAVHPTAYLTAEVHREQANLAGDSGDRAAAVAAFQAALTAQPHWLYRTIELVSAELAGGSTRAARAALDAAATETPDDLETIESLAGDAVFATDARAAGALWSRALALAPDDPRILDASGEVAVAARNDLNTGISLFARALRTDPHDAEAAACLLAIATVIEHDPARGRAEIAAAVLAGLPAGTLRRHLPAIPDPLQAVASDGQVALAAVNTARRAAGLPAVRLDPRLSASALSHSFYWVFNYFAPSASGLGIHLETAGNPGYTAAYPWTRAVVFGYPNQRIGEDITHSGAPDSAVADWVNSVFHRFAIMRPDLRVVGYGEASVTSVVIEDMEFGFAVATHAAPVLYPGAGGTNVPATFVDNELPDPVPVGAPRVTGYPVTVTFSAADRVSLRSFTLAGPGGGSLAAYLLAPSHSTENSASLLPVAPLVAGGTYAAHISATLNGAQYQRTWTFTVAG